MKDRALETKPNKTAITELNRFAQEYDFRPQEKIYHSGSQNGEKPAKVLARKGSLSALVMYLELGVLSQEFSPDLYPEVEDLITDIINLPSGLTPINILERSQIVTSKILAAAGY